MRITITHHLSLITHFTHLFNNLLKISNLLILCRKLNNQGSRKPLIFATFE